RSGMNGRWLARVAASAAVRPLVYLAIAGLIALVLSFVPASQAQAQGCSTAFNIAIDNCATRPEAYAAAKAAGDARCAWYYGAANCAATVVEEIPWNGTKGGYWGIATSIT